MNPIVFTEAFPEPPFCEREILRYARCGDYADAQTEQLLQSCIEEARTVLVYKVCHCELSLQICGNICDFGCFTTKSQGLAKNLTDSESVILMAATTGVGLDRLIAKYGYLSPARALMLSAIGTERIEALCDNFCTRAEKKSGRYHGMRFSPGYGDLELSVQREIFSVLGCEKRIGLFLSDSLMMTPSKSVTAFVGLSGTPYAENKNKCSLCNKKDCLYRGTL